MTSLHELVAAAGGPSARPDSIVSLMEVIEDPLVDAHKLLPVVQRDPGLTAGLLKLCNSPLYGFKRRIGSPAEALVLVGNLTFARLCFTLSLEPVLHNDLPGYHLDLDTLWQHSLATAYGAGFLMKISGHGVLKERAFTAGLLHDIGKLALDGVLAQGPGDEAEPLRVTRELEIAHAGHDHAEVGAALLDSWDLPEQIIQAVRWHHQPQQAPAGQKLPAAVHVANKVARIVSRFQAGSRALDDWVETACGDDPFPTDAVGKLAGQIASTRQNILSLATGPTL